MKILVFDIGGTAIKYGICQDGQLEETKECPTEAFKGGPHILNTICCLADQYLPFDAIGISTAGQVNPEEGSIIYANSAIIESGQVYHGSSFSAGEFGAVITHAEEKLSGTDPFDGCYERYASATALVKMVSEIDPSLTNGRQIFANLERPEIKAVVNKWIDEIVLGLTTLIHIFNPSCIVLGGGIMVQPYILEQINTRIPQMVMASFSHVQISSAKLGNSAGLLGAYYLAAQKFEMSDLSDKK